MDRIGISAMAIASPQRASPKQRRARQTLLNGGYKEAWPEQVAAAAINDYVLEIGL
jgi:hypothetical protein